LKGGSGDRAAIGSAGSGGTDVIVPFGQGPDTTRRFFPHILDAISQIQQFYVIEANGQSIPSDFLTLRGQMNFFNVGFGAGFLEALFFALLMSISLIIISEDNIRHSIARFFPLIDSNMFLWTTTLLPVLISGGLCSYLSKFYIGHITRKSIDSLLLGRVISMIFKGTIIFFLLIFLSSHITPKSAWTIANTLSLHHYPLAVNLYYMLMKMKPILVNRAFEILGIFTLAIAMPFFFVWGVALARKIKAKMNQKRIEAI